MARRVLEAELLASQGMTPQPMGPAKAVELFKEFKLHKTFSGIFSLQFNYNGDTLAVGFGAGGIQTYATNTGTLCKELRSCRQGGYAIMVLRFHPKDPNILYAASTEGHIYVLNISTGETLATLEEMGNEINCMDFSVDGYNFATGGKDLAIRIYETKSNKVVKTYPGFGSGGSVFEKNQVGNTMRVFSLKFHPNNQYIFVSGGWDNHVKIWDIRDNDGIKRNISGPHICGDSIDLMENRILTGQWTALHALQEFNYTTGALSREIKYPNTDGAFLYASLYSNEDTVFAGGSGTNRAELIEISTNRHIGGHQMPAPVHALDSACQGRILAAGGAGASFVILKVLE
ncbi:unnamed protein product [Lymnaea stagnalis]|uniref:Anaphase-promoting complex subunit 4 WD40 domain-containing protein n=1 Tax=Lymnaea stagnalis TaxID=6523 RepID=A0AAV2IB36_LYMST